MLNFSRNYVPIRQHNRQISVEIENDFTNLKLLSRPIKIAVLTGIRKKTTNHDLCNKSVRDTMTAMAK